MQKSTLISTFPQSIRFVLYALLAVCIAVLLINIWRIRKERKLLALERERIHESKLRFFTNISQDLRTPLTMIVGPLRRLISDNEGKSLAKDLENIERSARILMKQIDKVLDFKQISTGDIQFHPSYGDIAQFIGEICKSYSSIKDTDTSLTYDTGATPIMANFDRDKVRFILTYLLDRSFKYGKASHANVSVSCANGHAIVRITDDGIEDRKSDEFNPDIINEYVRLHDGSVFSASMKPSGYIEEISFPIAEETGQRTDTGKDVTRRTGRQFILNVEDNPAFRYFITENLSKSYDIAEAATGEEALEMISHNSFDLILCSLSLPEMDGRELCRTIRKDIRNARTPIIILSSVIGEDVALENLRAGADDTLEKPFSIETLLVRIEKLLNRKVSPTPSHDVSGNKISRMDQELLKRVTEHIEENLQDSEYTIEELCSSLSMSRSGLYKKMITLTGKSPLEFIHFIRLEKGREMLESGETSVSQIAWNVGFSPKQFSKHFKKTYGCLPSEYIHHLAE